VPTVVRPRGVYVSVPLTRNWRHGAVMPWPWRERLRPLRMGSIVQMPASNSELTSVSAGQRVDGGRDRVEPVTSSVSANGGEALCGSPFAQVATNRQWRSYAFSFPAVGWMPTPGS
jgi:hypothetical protein